VIRLLNEYVSAMIAVVSGHQGSVEQLVGDEIVALFGVGEGSQDAAVRAVRAAVDMVDGTRALAARSTTSHAVLQA
jgi:class 3 adenylate cyclase